MKFLRTEKMPKTFRKGCTLFIVAMLIIPIAWFIVFYLIINFNSIIMAFKTIVGLDDYGRVEYKWGFENYSQLWLELTTPNSNMQISLFNSLRYSALNIFLIVPLTYVVSYFLYKKILFHKFFRVLFYLPSIMSSVAMVIIYKNFVSGYGPIYELCEHVFGFRLPPLMTDARYATATIMVYCVWVGFGVNIVLYQGAMGRIPTEIIEAGKLEGISWWRELFSVVTPLVWSTVSMTLVLAVTGIFTVNVPILLFGTGGAYETYTISFYIFSLVYCNGVFNYAASIGVFFTICGLPIVFGFRWLMGKLDPKIEY